MDVFFMKLDINDQMLTLADVFSHVTSTSTNDNFMTIGLKNSYFGIVNKLSVGPEAVDQPEDGVEVVPLGFLDGSSLTLRAQLELGGERPKLCVVAVDLVNDVQFKFWVMMITNVDHCARLLNIDEVTFPKFKAAVYLGCWAPVLACQHADEVERQLGFRIPRFSFTVRGEWFTCFNFQLDSNVTEVVLDAANERVEDVEIDGELVCAVAQYVNKLDDREPMVVNNCRLTVLDGYQFASIDYVDDEFLVIYAVDESAGDGSERKLNFVSSGDRWIPIAYAPQQSSLLNKRLETVATLTNI